MNRILRVPSTKVQTPVPGSVRAAPPPERRFAAARGRGFRPGGGRLARRGGPTEPPSRALAPPSVSSRSAAAATGHSSRALRQLTASSPPHQLVTMALSDLIRPNGFLKLIQIVSKRTDAGDVHGLTQCRDYCHSHLLE